MKKFLAIAILLTTTLAVSAQEYKWAFGVRGGAFSGLTAKMNNGSNALEAGVSWGIGNYLTLDGVYEWQQPVIAEGINLYYGVGGYLGLAGSNFCLGAEGVIGLEYQLPINFPLAISLDYRPALNVLPGLAPNFVNFGFGIKYCF
jgi:hypothetical protein